MRLQKSAQKQIQVREKEALSGQRQPLDGQKKDRLKRRNRPGWKEEMVETTTRMDAEP